MTFNKSWDETSPDGDIITVSLLDDSIRDTKYAIRERLEGDPSDPFSGIFERNSFAASSRVRQGTARAFTSDVAGVAGLPRIDGAIAVTTGADSGRLYHLSASGPVEAAYVNLNGSRPLTGPLNAGAFNITNVAPGTQAGHVAEWSQAAIVNQQRTISGLWTFNRGSGQAPFAIASGSLTVTNLDADKLDGLDSSAFATAVHNHDASQITSGTLPAARLIGGYTGITSVGVLSEVVTSGPIISSLATGTAPIQVTSTNLCTNLNADQLDGQHASAFAAASHNHAASDIISGTLAVARGGTGKSSYVAGGILYASGTGTLADTGLGSKFNVLRGGTTPGWYGNAQQCTVLTNDFATTSASFVSSGLSVSISANETWLVTFDLLVSGPTDGGQFMVSGPTGSVIILGYIDDAFSVSNSVGTNQPATGTVLAGRISKAARVFAYIDNGANAGSVVLNVAATTPGQQMRIKAGSVMTSIQLS